MSTTLLATVAVAAMTAAPSAAADLPAHYRALFQPDRSWRFEIVETTTLHDYDPDTDEPTHTTEQETTRTRCSVDSVGPEGGALVSRIQCKPEDSQQPWVAGAWAATKKGVWFLGDLKGKAFAGVKKKAHGKPWLTPRQKAGKWTVDADAGCTLEVKAKEVPVYGDLKTSAWCVERYCEPPHGGDGVWEETCYAPEVGPVAYRYEASHGAIDMDVRGAAVDPLPRHVVDWREARDEGEAGVAAVVETWARAQNARDFAAYSATYGPTFEGIKRTSKGKVKTYARDAWLKDRKRMFDGGGQQVVLRDGALVLNPEETEATVTFTQLWRSPTYADRGTKELKLRRDGQGPWLIVAEDMKTSERWDGRLNP